jgi:hypothetical protein
MAGDNKQSDQPMRFGRQDGRVARREPRAVAAIRVINTSPHRAKTARPDDRRLVCFLVGDPGAARLHASEHVVNPCSGSGGLAAVLVRHRGCLFLTRKRHSVPILIG